MSNIVPQPQITFENNKIYVDSPVDVKYTLDGLDPVFYGVIYTSPISISHTTTIKAISVNSLGEFSNLVAGTFTPESDVSDGSSNSSWVPVTYTYILNPSPGGGADLSNYTTYSYINSYYTSYSYINANYTTFSYLEDKNYATEQYVDDAIGNIEFPEPDLSSYVTKTELSNQSYLTSIPSEYITQTELSACGYITINDVPASPDLSGYLLSPIVSGYTGQMRLFNDGFLEVTSNGNVRAKTFTYNSLNSWSAYTLINRDSLRNYVNGRLSEIEGSYVTTTDLNNYLPYLGTLSAHYTNSEHFIPKANNAYYLGNTNFRWQLAYTYNIYTQNLYADNLYTYSLTRIYSTSNYNINFNLNGGNRYSMDTLVFSPINDNTRNLGSSSSRWANTYTANLWADNIHNFIWTGTSAEYALLDNYTSYQIYLIKES